LFQYSKEKPKLLERPRGWYDIEVWIVTTLQNARRSQVIST